MEHVVFFPAQDGTPAFRRVGALEEAVRLVEHLRNVEGVSEVSVHALSEVPLSFKTWYRVELPDAAPVEASAAAPPVVDEAAPEVPEVPAAATDVTEVAPGAVVEDVPVSLVPEQPADAAVPVLAGSNGRPADAPTSLGFFA